MFFKLFFPEKAPDWSRTFPAKKQNSHMTNVGRGIFFSSWNLTGGAWGFSTCDRIFFFFLGRPKFLWSWHISGSFGQNFRVLMEETFARTGLIKKKKKKKKRPQALNQAVLMAQSLSFFFGHQRALVAGFLQFFL